MRHAEDRLQQLASAVDKVSQDLDARLVADTAKAAGFHVASPKDATPIIALVGGTGTGKSTLVNRLLDAPDRGDDALVATSFRRTHTTGCVAIVPNGKTLPDGWMGVRHVPSDRDSGPARGEGDDLVILSTGDSDFVPVDTPDLDGDVVEHHRRAERAFRWATAIVLVATPEKYQLPEADRFTTLASRWDLPLRVVMNKADDLDAADDWQTRLGDATVFVVPRDDAPLSSPGGRSLDDLRASLSHLEPADDAGLRTRLADVAGRAADLVLEPARTQRRRCDDAAERLRALIRPEAGVDVHPMTRQLQSRLRKQSVLYLMGPGRIIDRARSLPGVVARLPRSAWDLVTRGKLPDEPADDTPAADAAPDFPRDVGDAFDVFAARCDDAMKEAGLSPDGEAWKLPRDRAEEIATERLAELRRWLEARWDKKPRDTRAIEWLAKHVPGGKHVTKLSETAPYLLVAASAATSVVTAGAEQVVIGGYLLTTWLGERLSNEVAAKTRQTNAALAADFAKLCDEQAQRAIAWCDAAAASPADLTALDKAVDAVASLAEGSR
ncbi:MAG: GTPase domain-containing protein [Planctomycetota bacterium]